MSKGVLLAAVVVAIATFVAVLIGLDMAPSADSRLIDKAEAAVRERLADPDSAKFDSVTVIDIPGTRRTVCGNINSKNRFGGYTGRRLFAYDGALPAIDGDPPDIAWIKELLSRCPSQPVMVR